MLNTKLYKYRNTVNITGSDFCFLCFVSVIPLVGFSYVLLCPRYFLNQHLEFVY